jgi:hypothetical protein
MPFSDVSIILLNYTIDFADFYRVKQRVFRG